MNGIKYQVEVIDDNGCFTSVIQEILIEGLAINSVGYCFKREVDLGPRVDAKLANTVSKIDIAEEDYNLMKQYIDTRKKMRELKERLFNQNEV